MSTNIDLLPVIEAAEALTSQDGDIRLTIGFVSGQGASKAPIAIDGIKFTISWVPALTLPLNLPVLPVVTLSTDGSAPTLFNDGASGFLYIVVPQAIAATIPSGGYKGQLVAMADGKVEDLGAIAFRHSVLGSCRFVEFQTLPRNAASATSVGYVPNGAVTLPQVEALVDNLAKAKTYPVVISIAGQTVLPLTVPPVDVNDVDLLVNGIVYRAPDLSATETAIAWLGDFSLAPPDRVFARYS